MGAYDPQDRNPYHENLRGKLRISRYLSTALFAIYSSNFLVFANRSTVVRTGGIFASPIVWGLLFLVSAFLNLESLLRPDIGWLYQLSQMAMLGTVLAWTGALVIVTAQTGMNVVGWSVWLYVAGTITMRIWTAREAGDAWGIPMGETLESLFSRWRRKQVK